MKMKSMFFGLNAKLVLAVLAVGTMFTGCYEEKGVDVIPGTGPDITPAKYYVTGNIYNGTTGEAVAAAIKVTAKSGATVTLADASTFSLEVKAGDEVAVAVSKTGFYTVTRKVTIGTAAVETVNYTNVDIALFADDAAPVTPPSARPEATTPVTPPTSSDFAGWGLPLDPNKDTPAFDGNGQATAYALEAMALDPATVGRNVEVTYNRVVESFVIQNVVVGTATKAISDVDAGTLSYLAKCIASETGIPYAGKAFKTVSTTATLRQKPNIAVIGISVKTILTLQKVAFVYDGKSYTVYFMTATQSGIGFAYDSHDSHDYHDIHGGNGGNPNAGGGMGGSNL